MDENTILNEFSNAYIHCENANENIYAFAGFLKFNDRELQVSIDIDQLLLRGSSLRNTEYVYGVAIYTGHDTRVMMNSSKGKPKFSQIEKKTNMYIVLGIIFQTVVCLTASIVNTVNERYVFPGQIDLIYIYNTQGVLSEDVHDNWGMQLVKGFCSWFLIMMNFVSISLIVSLEMVKFVQGIFIEYDYMIYDETKDMAAVT